MQDDLNPAADQDSLRDPPEPIPVLMPRWLQAIGKCVDISVILMGACLALLIFFNVVLRIFGKDLAWLLEFGEMLMVWVTFLGGAAAAQRGAHMTINEFLDKLTTRTRRYADAAVQLLSLSVLLIVVWNGIQIVQHSWGGVLTTLEWPMAWQYMPLPLGCGLMALFISYDLWLIAKGVPREQRYSND